MALDAEHARTLRSLLETRPVAALATLHGGDPAVSMVPYALLPRGGGFVIHVSRLASHTADLQAHPAVALLVTGDLQDAPSPQQLPRASIRGEARTLTPGTALHAEARAAYLARFPETEPLFGFADFSLVLVGMRTLRFVGGFAQAVTVMPPEFQALMGGETRTPAAP